MNIFILDYNMEENAKQYCNAHIVKMITEHTQILCTAYWFYNLSYIFPLKNLKTKEQKRIYKQQTNLFIPTHINHPCNIWARESFSNYQYLYRLNQCLHNEWKYRFNHTPEENHKSYLTMLRIPQDFNFNDKGLTQFTQAMPEQYRNADTVKAYRSYYINEKKFSQWIKRPVPQWFTENKKFTCRVEK